MNRSVRPRPAFLRALGRHEPPAVVTIDGCEYRRIEVFKHDSWAATAHYRGPDGDVVCKFNRVQSIFGLPMTWLGRRLAKREALALRRLSGLPGIPAACGPVSAGGRRLENAVAHAYVPGHPLGSRDCPGDEFFPELRNLLDAVHRHGVAYVDLHKRENVLVGDDGRPYLLDFQVCFGLWFPRSAKNPLLRLALRALQGADRYHFAKHVKHHRPDQLTDLAAGEGRPWWIEVHRLFAVPLRRLRRALLAELGVRAKGGSAATEVFPEDAVRREIARAA
jgi:hypothetical protein